MKLKKIASLALAGIMAVSMLAGCKDGAKPENSGNGENNNPSSSYTDTVLAATNAATKTKLSASTNTKLDQGVAWAARNDRGSNGATATVLTDIPANWGIVTLAETYMKGNKLNAYMVDDKWNFSPASLTAAKVSDPITYWTMYYVSSTVSDEYITNEVAAKLDAWAKDMANKGEEVTSGTSVATWDYTVSVSKANCAGADLDTKNDDYIIVGIAITVDKTDVNY